MATVTFIKYKSQSAGTLQDVARYVVQDCKTNDQHPTQTQTAALARDVAAIRESLTQAGRKNEKRFSLPSIRLPRLHLPEWDWPTVVTILLALAVLFLMWWAWAGDWSSLSLLSL